MFTALQTNFPCKVRSVPATWIVKEENKSASFNEVEIISDGDFVVIDISLYKDWKGFLNSLGVFKPKRSPKEWFEDRDCDGVSLVREDGQDYMLLVELKSTFNSSEIFGAYKQLYYTLLKIHILLSLCDGYSPSKLKARGVIACHPPKDEKGMLAALMLHRQKCQTVKRYHADIDFVLNLYRSSPRTLYLKVGAVPFIQNLALPKDLKEMDLKIHLQLANKLNHTNKIVDLLDLL